MGMNQSMGMTQQSLTTQQAPVQQTNFSLNAQHFATQQLPSQNFGTGFNLNAQSFGTQNLMGQNTGVQQ